MAQNAKEILTPMLEKYRREQREKEREQLNNLRELEIGQKVKKFKSPASKRAVSFLLESKNDWEDCLTEFKPLLGEDDKLDWIPWTRKRTKLSPFWSSSMSSGKWKPGKKRRNSSLMRLQIDLRLVGSRRVVTTITCLSLLIIPSSMRRLRSHQPRNRRGWERLKEKPRDSLDLAAASCLRMIVMMMKMMITKCNLILS